MPYIEPTEESDEEFDEKVRDISERLEREENILTKDLLHFDRRFVVENLIEEESIVAFYGAPKSGKSLSVQHLCHSLAMGQAWCNHEVKYPSHVIYFAFEDPTLLKLRAKALYATFPPPTLKECGQVKIIGNPPDVFRKETLWAIEEEFANMSEMFEAAFRILVIDTLAMANKNLGDENTSTAMAKVVKQLQDFNFAGITVILVHHSGKDRTKGMRGHNSLEAGIDNIFEVSKKKETVSIKQTHWRNGESGKTIKLNIIQTLVKVRGFKEEPLLSVPVLNFNHLSLKAPKNFSRAELIVLKEITTLLETNPFDPPPNIEIPLNVKAALLEDVYKATKAAGISPNGKSPRASKIATVRALENLNEKGLIEYKDGFIWEVYDDETLPDK
jgi:hypothetical protein